MRKVANGIRLVLAPVVAAVSVAYLVLWLTDPFRISSSAQTRIVIKSDCPFSQKAIELYEAAGRPDDVLLIPLDAGAEGQEACSNTVRILREQSALMRLAPQGWLCDRLVADADSWFGAIDAARRTPTFVSSAGEVVALGYERESISATGNENLRSAFDGLELR